MHDITCILAKRVVLDAWNAQYQNQPYEDILLNTLPRHGSSLKWLQFLGIWLWNQQKNQY